MGATMRFLILSFLCVGCVESYAGQRESTAIEACGKACGQLEENESASAKRVYPCLESINFTTHAGGSDLACRCRCAAPDGGEIPREVWR